MTQVPGPSPRPSVGERVTAVVLLLLFLLECLVAGFFGVFVAMVSDGCMGADERCNDALITTGVVVASPGQLVPAVAAVLWFALRWRAGRSTWFVPLVMAPVPPVLFLIGASIAEAGVP